jgi:chromosome segregation ATPase
MHGSLAQHEIEKAQKEKADVTQKTDKFAKEETKVDFDRTTKKRIDAVRDQIENGPKSLAILNDRFTHGQVRLASLIDQRAKLKTALPQVTIDETRLQGAAKRLEDEIWSATKRKDAIASEIGRAEDRLHQLQQDRVSEDQLHQLQQDRVSEDQLNQLQQDRVRQTIGRDRYKRLTDDLRKQSEHSRKNVAELERKRAMLALPTKIPAAVPLVDQPNQEERREPELRSQDAELDATRIELEQNIKVLQATEGGAC